MKSTILWTLVVLNALLTGVFVFRLFPDNAAHAQAAAANNRRPGDYVLVPGELSNGSNAIIYVLDSTNGQLSALAYDDPRNEIASMSSIDLARVFDAGDRRRANGK
jgi:hypothetical protein